MYSASTLVSLCQARFAPDRKLMSGRHVHVLPLHSGNAALAEGTMICVQSELGPSPMRVQVKDQRKTQHLNAADMHCVSPSRFSRLSKYKPAQNAPPAISREPSRVTVLHALIDRLSCHLRLRLQ